jgi:hypothetical protein
VATEEVATAVVDSGAVTEGTPVVEVDIPVEIMMISVSCSLIFVRTDLFILIIL